METAHGDARSSVMESPTGNNFERDLYGAIPLHAGVARQQYSAAIRIAECLERSVGRADELPGGDLTDDPEFAALARATKRHGRRCVGGALDPSFFMLLNGALSEVLLRGNERDLPDRAELTDIVAARRFIYRPEGPTIQTLGRCLALFSPGLSMAVLGKVAGSAEEDRAMGKLYSATPECGLSSAPAKIGKDLQRAALASGLFQRNRYFPDG